MYFMDIDFAAGTVTCAAHPSTIREMGRNHPLCGPPTRVVARRGLVREAHENTLEACDLAVRAGADGIALDVATTRDGVLFCFRDDPVARACLLGPGAPELSEWSSDDVAAVTLPETVAYPRARIDYGRAAAIPRLEDVLASLRCQTLVVIRLAASGISADSSLPGPAVYRLATRAAELVCRLGLIERALFTSTDALALHRVRRATRGRAATAFQWDDTVPLIGAHTGRGVTRPGRTDVVLGPLARVLDRLKISGPARRLLGSGAAATFEFTSLARETVHELKAQGTLVGSHTLFPLDLHGREHAFDETLQARILERLAQAGLDWVETDDPRRARDVIDRGWTATFIAER